MARQSDSAALWTGPRLRTRLLALCRQTVDDACVDTPEVQRAIVRIVRIGMTPAVQQALRGRQDPDVALRDLVVVYAFRCTYEHPHEVLDPFSAVLMRRTLDRMHEVAEELARRLGENPLDAEQDLISRLLRSLGRFVPKVPLDYHIRYKLEHYESAVSRCMRQIENLVKKSPVMEQFVEMMLTADAPDTFKAHLLNMARGNGRTGVDYEATVLFFARPSVMAFVKQFAGTVQPARTLYAEELYEGIEWHGKRALPRKRRQNYLDPALAQVFNARMLSLDEPRGDGGVSPMEWMIPKRS